MIESEVNKSLCLYIRQDYSKPRQEEIARLKKAIVESNSALEKKTRQIKELEDSQLKNLELLGALERFIDTERKANEGRSVR